MWKKGSGVFELTIDPGPLPPSHSIRGTAAGVELVCRPGGRHEKSPAPRLRPRWHRDSSAGRRCATAARRAGRRTCHASADPAGSCSCSRIPNSLPLDTPGGTCCMRGGGGACRAFWQIVRSGSAVFEIQTSVSNKRFKQALVFDRRLLDDLVRAEAVVGANLFYVTRAAEVMAHRWRRTCLSERSPRHRDVMPGWRFKSDLSHVLVPVFALQQRG